MSVCGEGEEKKPLRNKSEITHNNEGFIIVSVLATLNNYIKTLQKIEYFVSLSLLRLQNKIKKI